MNESKIIIDMMVGESPEHHERVLQEFVETIQDRPKSDPQITLGNSDVVGWEYTIEWETDVDQSFRTFRELLELEDNRVLSVKIGRSKDLI